MGRGVDGGYGAGAAPAAGGDAQAALDVTVVLTAPAVHARPVMAMPSPWCPHVLSLVPGALASAIHDWSSFWASAGSNGWSPRRWLFVGRSSSCAVAWGSPFGTVQGVKLELHRFLVSYMPLALAVAPIDLYAATDAPVGLSWFVCSQNLQTFRCCDRYGCSVSTDCEPAGERADRARDDSRCAPSTRRRCMHAHDHAHDCSMLP